MHFESLFVHKVVCYRVFKSQRQMLESLPLGYHDQTFAVLNFYRLNHLTTALSNYSMVTLLVQGEGAGAVKLFSAELIDGQQCFSFLDLGDQNAMPLTILVKRFEDNLRRVDLSWVVTIREAELLATFLSSVPFVTNRNSDPLFRPLGVHRVVWPRIRLHKDICFRLRLRAVEVLEQGSSSF